MASAIFDTHAFVKRLTAAGMPEAQAEILAEEQARLIDERLATKADLARAIPDETDPPRTPTRFAHREKIALIIGLEQLHPDDDRQGAIASDRMLL